MMLNPKEKRNLIKKDKGKLNNIIDVFNGEIASLRKKDKNEKIWEVRMKLKERMDDERNFKENSCSYSQEVIEKSHNYNFPDFLNKFPDEKFSQFLYYINNNLEIDAMKMLEEFKKLTIFCSKEII